MNATLKQKQIFVLYNVSNMDLTNTDIGGCSEVIHEFFHCSDCLVGEYCSKSSYDNGTVKSLAKSLIKDFTEEEILTSLVIVGSLL